MATAVGDDDAMDQRGEGGLSPQAGKAGPGKGQDAGAAVKPARAPRKKDPKLDLDLLEADGGFNDIWHKMAPAFKASFQGEGHEVADLRRLLELYQRWQTRFYPHCDFDTFVTKLEKAGRSRLVKAKMGSMRQNLLGLIFPPEAREAEAPAIAADGAGGGAAAGAAAGGRGDAGTAHQAGLCARGATTPRVLYPAGGMEWCYPTMTDNIDWEEWDHGNAPAQSCLPCSCFVAIAMKQHVNTKATPAAAAATTGRGANTAGGGGDYDEDDELVALQRETEWEAAYDAMDELEMAPPPRPREQPQQLAGTTTAAAAGGGGGAAANDVDMDELMELAEELHYKPGPLPPATAPAAVQRLPSGSQPQAGPAGNGGPEGRGDRAAAGSAMAYDNDADEELMALAMGYDVVPPPDVAQRRDSGVRDVGGGGGGGGRKSDQDGDAAAAGTEAVANPAADPAASAPAETRGNVLDDMDEELRMLAEMDTVEAKAVVALRHGAALMDVDDAPDVRQYGGTEELDAELLALAAGGDTQATTAAAPLGVDDLGAGGSAGVYGSCGREAGVSNAGEDEELRVLGRGCGVDDGAAGPGVMSKPGSAAQRHRSLGASEGAEGSAACAACTAAPGDDGGGGLVAQSEGPLDSQGLGTGLLLRDLLMTQTQSQGEGEEREGV
ncbi:hypothetical protein VOLCADRAFT_103804 [Volvox carteri f. nagariensis]|uniref:Chromosome segregation in meiosis protein 3 domain-containing protein n=1 Tax=Volvox carteri f. nagariensis TaxID=3068 RepID=D8TPB2_VOLCA|nr:uncharacterized protein VOLCADRAFT_103804 [Volvox carteri f. nagariensis]EFJ50730.1 hypothetical protein VOLCADRAFT_103804 [Volvox carteri f. nagariensis]|eukprot:XP_002948323.1 hypothetical protein VOLCADRAFT_103804 [Volvox carteri f. nagariensis]